MSVEASTRRRLPGDRRSRRRRRGVKRVGRAVSVVGGIKREAFSDGFAERAN